MTIRNDARSERRLGVLKAIVRSFVATGEPVGSKTIAGGPGCAVSPATLRSVMAELEELGYLSQPHPSAGRIPTSEGYRLYADLVLEQRRTSPVEPAESVLGEELAGAAELPEVLAAASRTLSRLCQCVGVVLRPRFAQTRFLHAHFLRVDRCRVLAVVVGDGGVLSDRVVQLEDDMAQDELDRIGNYLLNRFRGSTLCEVERTLVEELGEERAAYDAARRHWLKLALAGFERRTEDEEVYVDGAARCVEATDFEDVEQLRQLVRAYEEKGRIARLLEHCLEREGVQVRIGSRGGSEDGGVPSGLAFVAVQYGDLGRPLGSLGVLGPSRMEYDKVITVVDGVARDLGRALSAGFPVSH